eukprot:533612_1
MSENSQENKHTCGLCGASYTTTKKVYKWDILKSPNIHNRVYANSCPDCQLAKRRLSGRNSKRIVRQYAKDNHISEKDSRRELAKQKESSWSLTCCRCLALLHKYSTRGYCDRFRSIKGDVCSKCYNKMRQKSDWLEKINFKSDTNGKIIFKNERGKSIQERLFFRAFEDNITFVFGDRDVTIIPEGWGQPGKFKPDKFYKMKIRTLGFNKEFDEMVHDFLYGNTFHVINGKYSFMYEATKIWFTLKFQFDYLTDYTNKTTRYASLNQYKLDSLQIEEYIIATRLIVNNRMINEEKIPDILYLGSPEYMDKKYEKINIVINKLENEYFPVETAGFHTDFIDKWNKYKINNWDNDRRSQLIVLFAPFLNEYIETNNIATDIDRTKQHRWNYGMILTNNIKPLFNKPMYGSDASFPPNCDKYTKIRLNDINTFCHKIDMHWLDNEIANFGEINIHFDRIKRDIERPYYINVYSSSLVCHGYIRKILSHFNPSVICFLNLFIF